MASRLVNLGVRSRKLSNVGQWLDKWAKIYCLELLRASKGTLSPTNHIGPAWWAMARSSYVLSIRKACAPAVIAAPADNDDNDVYMYTTCII
jgi:hypothetical protein